MPVVSAAISLSTQGEAQVVDITGELGRAIAESGLAAGVATVFVPGATGAVTTIEYEGGLLEDIDDLFERLAPSGVSYAHNRSAGDDNGHAHVRASLLGPSLGVPFADGAPLLGRWQSVVFIDFDTRPRRRDLVVQMIGE